MLENVKFNDLKGKILSKLTVNTDNTEISITTKDNETFLMFHSQDCCEDVYVESITGDIEDILNTPILLAEESTNHDLPIPDEADSSYTWTFYKLATIKGNITIRWFGTSNGYYSEEVIFDKTN